MLYQFLRSLPLVGRLVARLSNWQYHWQNHPTQHLRRILGGRRDLFIVEIGSNDGKSGDPLYPLIRRNRSWQVLFVEPVPFLFERLKRNFAGNPRFRFEQVAIADRAGTLPFYHVSENARREEPHFPEFFEQLGSFYRANLEKHLPGEYERFIVEAPIEAMPLAAVLERQNVSRIDVLLIDTEGYDWEVLRQLDLSRFSPLVIFIEHKHLSPEDKAAMREFLRDYEITDLGHDFLCRRRGGSA
jgi:FkbM family methyltransferase